MNTSKIKTMNKEDAIKYLKQLYPNGGHCWLDEQRIEALGMAIDALQEEPVNELWHDASEEPNDMSSCLIFYGCKEAVGHYLHYEPVLYNKKEKVFVTPSFPHPTGYKVEQKSFDGGCVAEVYKDKRDRISISDITQWCYLCDLHNLSNVGRIGKKWKEPVSEKLEEAAFDYAEACKYEGGEKLLCVEHFKAGAKWGKNQAMAEIQAQSMALAHGCPKEELVSNDLEEAAVDWHNSVKYKSDLSGTPISAFKAGAEWKMNHLWKDAQGNDLPEIDREVIVSLKGGKVAFGHRPYKGKYIGKNLTTGNIETFENETYDEGGWNIPNVMYWLDCEIPKEMEE